MLLGGIKFVLGKIAAAVDAELNDDSRLREELRRGGCPRARARRKTNAAGLDGSRPLARRRAGSAPLRLSAPPRGQAVRGPDGCRPRALPLARGAGAIVPRPRRAGNVPR